ncbi:kynureninase [Bacillus timonensis]|nr:kynureninase [Bacillus timonensis]
MTTITIEEAKQLDQKDTLANYRNEFYIKEGQIYLDGNSLGLLSKRAEQALLGSLQDWKEHGIDGWTEGKQPWYTFSETLGEMTAPLLGAESDEVIVTGSTTINLHQLVATFYQPTGKRTKILADELAFPSDIYALQSQLKLKGYDPDEHLIRVQSRDGRTLEEDDIIAQMTDEIAMIVLPSVLYRSGQLLDLARLTEEAHKRGIVIGFDLAHSIGAIAHSFNEYEPDFAFWCNYKYLNSGPGGVGGLYVNKRHFGTVPGIAGWFSSNKQKQFDMEHTLTHADTAGAFQIGTPHVLSLAPLKGSLEMFQEVGIHSIREKSLQLTAFLIKLIEQELVDHGFTIANPRENHRRGGHVSLEHEDAASICKALKDKGVIPDYRSPNVIRLAPIALYSSYEEVWKSVQILKDIMDNGLYQQYENTRNIIA